MDKIIFLDIDGVLCTHRSQVGSMIATGTMETLDPIGVNMISYLCAISDAKVVISSTWRLMHKDLPMMFRMVGFRGKFHEVWKTPDAFNTNTHHTLRGDDLNQWLEENGDHEYIIIDDDSDFYDNQKERLIHTETKDGISYQNFRDACELLCPDQKHHKLFKSKLPSGWKN